MTGRFLLILATATLAAATTTQPNACVSPVQNSADKANYVVYETGPADTPYALAERFYGRSYLGYQIAEANKDLLTGQGFFPKGAKILIPPGLNGRPVDVNRMKQHTY